MISGAHIKALMAALSTGISTNFVRGGQTGLKQAYPFFRYNILSDQAEQIYQTTSANTLKSGDATTIDRTRTKKTQAVISINFVDKTSYDVIRGLAGNAYDWLSEETAEELLASQNMVLKFLGAIADRSSLIEPFVEHQVGFDIRLDANETKVSEIEAIQTVTAGVTVNDVEQDDFTTTIL